MKIQLPTCLVAIFCLMVCCTPKQDEVERINEDGVEVVFNHREPYAMTGAKTITIEKTLTIDTENDEIAGLGLTDISHMDVDSAGKIFVANPSATNDCIFKFNENGQFIFAFGDRGEGPGEFQRLLHMEISDLDEIIVTDRGKVVAFSNTGEFLKEFRIDREYQKIIPLNEDRYLAIAVKLQEDMSQSFQAILCSSELEELKILDSTTIGSFMKMDKVNIIPTLLYWETSSDSVFTGDTEEYEIRVFDFEGKMVRRIRKEHEAVFLTEEDKEGYRRRIQSYPPEIKDSFFIPETYPPFKNIVALSDNRFFVQTFVQTYEESKDGTYIYDIYNSEGVYINRVEFEGLPVKFFGENVYCLDEKSSGYIELVVYKINWK